MDLPFSPLIFTALLSLLLGYPAMLLAQRFNVMDIPGSASHKVHTRPTPLAGGILAALTLAAAMLFFHSRLSSDILAVLAGAFIIFVFGLWDDMRGLSAAPKLAGQLLALAVLLFFNVKVNFIGTLAVAVNSPFWLTTILNMIVTFFWVVGITNAVNMIDSMDGIVAGLGVVVSACFSIAAWLSGQLGLSFWAAALLGVSIGLYFWNRMPARFFLGDSGSQVMGFLLASFGMMYNPRNFYPDSSWIVPILLLSIPIFDTTLVVISRLQKGQSVKSGRRDHAYHRLVAYGFSPKNAVHITHAAILILNVLAFPLLYLRPIIALPLFGVVLFCGALALRWFLQIPTLDEQNETI